MVTNARIRLAALALAIVAGLAACSPPEQADVPRPSPRPSASPYPAPEPLVSPSPSVIPSPPPPAARKACVEVRPDRNFQALIDANPPGSTFCVEAGMYRVVTPLVPRTGDRFLGERGAVLNGSKVLTAFVSEGGRWIAEGQGQGGPVSGFCDGGYRGCMYPDAVFLDDLQLWRVTSLGELGSGKFYFDYERDRIYLADNPAGRNVEAAVASAAFRATSRAGGTSDRVVIRGLVVEKFANPAQNAAIAAQGKGWIVERNEVRLNHGIGISARNGTVVRNNHVHHQGQMGLSANGPGVRIEGNEVAFNNTAGFSSDWEAGGSKFARTDGLVVSGNFSHDNKGPGLWTDIDNVNTLYENNRVMNNEGAGIFHEISFDAVIRGNTVTGNGFRRGSPGTAGALQGSPGIYIANSRNVTIDGNTVDGNRNGIVLTQHQREPGPRGQYLLQNVVVRANNITMTTGMSGFFYRSGSFSQLANAGITFSNNVYRLGGERLYFLWHNVPQTVQAWQAFGQDLQTTFAGEAAERPAH